MITNSLTATITTTQLKISAKAVKSQKKCIKDLHIEYSGYSNTEQHRHYPSYNLYSIYIGNATDIQWKITNCLKQETNESGNAVNLSKHSFP